MNSYTADLIVNVPYVINDKNIFDLGIGEKKLIKNENVEIYSNMMDTVFNYECVNNVCATTKRVYIGSQTVECESDSQIHKKERNSLDADLYIVYNRDNSLAVLSIVVLGEDNADISFMLEELYRGNGKVKFWGEGIAIDRYMSDVYGLNRCGDMKSCLTLSNYPADRKEMLYFNAAEQFGTQDVDSFLKENPKLKFSDISQYEAQDVYSSNPIVVSILKDFSSDLSQRLYHEALVELIEEMTLFKLIAINRTNKRVIEALENGNLPDTSVINELTTQFAATIRFWDIDNFIYFTTRNLAKSIADSFGADEKMQIYYRNQSVMEHLINIRAAKSAEKEEKILNFMAIALTLLQIIPMFYSIYQYVLFGSLSFKEVVSSVASCATVSLFALLIIFMLKRSLRK